MEGVRASGDTDLVPWGWGCGVGWGGMEVRGKLGSLCQPSPRTWVDGRSKGWAL